MFDAHHWPRWGNDRVQESLRGQRDLYAHFNNQVLHLTNQGVTVSQIHNVYELPKSLQQRWVCRGYHGSVPHNARAVVNRYLGFFDPGQAGGDDGRLRPQIRDPPRHARSCQDRPRRRLRSGAREHDPGVIGGRPTSPAIGHWRGCPTLDRPGEIFRGLDRHIGAVGTIDPRSATRQHPPPHPRRETGLRIGARPRVRNGPRHRSDSSGRVVGAGRGQALPR